MVLAFFADLDTGFDGRGVAGAKVMGEVTVVGAIVTGAEEGKDVIVALVGDNVIVALVGDGVINALVGDDVIVALVGDDVIDALVGDGVIDALVGDDAIGADVIELVNAIHVSGKTP